MIHHFNVKIKEQISKKLSKRIKIHRKQNRAESELLMENIKTKFLHYRHKLV